MKFKLNRASNYRDETEIELNTLEELLDLATKEKEALVVREDKTITVYDDYME